MIKIKLKELKQIDIENIIKRIDNTKAIFILIELLQNIIKYSNRNINIEIQKEKDLNIKISNEIDNNQKIKLEEIFNKFISLSKDELKDELRRRKKSKKFKHSKGAGLGIIDVIRKSDKISVEFEKKGNNYIFTIQITIKDK